MQRQPEVEVKAMIADRIMEFYREAHLRGVSQEAIFEALLSVALVYVKIRDDEQIKVEVREQVDAGRVVQLAALQWWQARKMMKDPDFTMGDEKMLKESEKTLEQACENLYEIEASL
jgi:hypothetical protein